MSKEYRYYPKLKMRICRKFHIDTPTDDSYYFEHYSKGVWKRKLKETLADKMLKVLGVVFKENIFMDDIFVEHSWAYKDNMFQYEKSLKSEKAFLNKVKL